MKILTFFTIILITSSCVKVKIEKDFDHKTTAETFFRGVYGCEPSVVDKFANDSISISYPIFEKLFNKTEFKGKESVKNFSSGFCNRWENARITLHESILEENKLVLFWGFSAKFIGESIPNGPSKNTEYSWGGISFFVFDDKGKILSEIGDESPNGLIYPVKAN